MDLEAVRNHCMSLLGATEGFPFGSDTLVFKVGGKMFALTDADMFTYINIKVSPEVGIEMRERYPAVQPGYHMDKRHWVTVMMDGSLPPKLINDWITESHRLVMQGLTRNKLMSL